MDGSIRLNIADTIAAAYGNFDVGFGALLDWANDGRSLLYVETKHLSQNVGGDLIAYRVDSQHYDTLAANLRLNPEYTPDLKYAFIQWVEGDQVFDGMLSLDTGRLERIGGAYTSTKTVLSTFHRQDWSDISCWAIVSDDENPDFGLWAINIQNGTQRQLANHWGYRLYPDSEDVGVSLSPDGSVVAFVQDDQLHLVALEGQWSHTITLEPPPNILQNIYWSPDGSALVLLYRHSTDQTAPKTLQIVTIDGTEIRRIDNFPGEYQNLNVTRCG